MYLSTERSLFGKLQLNTLEFTLNIFRVIAEKLRNEEAVKPETYDIVTALMCDVGNFREITAELSDPKDIVDFLTDLYVYYESVVAEYDCITVDFQHSLILVSGSFFRVYAPPKMPAKPGT